MNTFEINLPLFQGPFDLLLFFIERDELEIKDIPISKITDDFLAYTKQLELINMEMASEFILVAATLMQIKAKMLLPRPEIDKNGDEIDPREDLVRHLLEYKKYKAFINDIATLEDQRLKLEKRGNIEDEIEELSKQTNVEAELQDFDLYKLLKIYIKIIDRYELDKTKPIHTVMPYPYNMENQKDYILTKVSANKKVSFLEILEDMPIKIAIIFNFLSILELLQYQKIGIVFGEGYNNFWIKEFENEELLIAQ